MKINLISSLGYFIFILFLIFFSIVFNQPSVLILVFAFILIVPVSLVIFFKVKDTYSFTLIPCNTSVELGNDAFFKLEYSSSSKLRLFSADVLFHAENRYFENNVISRLSIPIFSSKGTFTIPVKTSEIGLVHLSGNEIILTDYLNILLYKVSVAFEADIPVLPARISSRDLPTIEPKEGTDEYVESDSTGNVSSDVKEIREYRPGDRLQRVHWKLSAKLDDLFVKEMAHTSTLSIILLPELDRTNIQDTVATLVSFAEKMNNEKIRFEICVYNDKSFDLSYFVISDDTTLLEALTHLYCAPLYDSKNKAYDVFSSATGMSSTVVHICGKKTEIGEFNAY